MFVRMHSYNSLTVYQWLQHTYFHITVSLHLYNITVNNSDVGQDANITQVNITFSVNFDVNVETNGTDVNVNNAGVAGGNIYTLGIGSGTYEFTARETACSKQLKVSFSFSVPT